MNEITLPVSELKSALPGFHKIIGKRLALPVLGHLRLNRDSQGGVSLHVTDLDSHAIYHLPETQAGAPMDLLVPFAPLNQLVRRLASQEVVHFIPDGKQQILVKYPLAGSLMEQKLNTLPADEFPPLPKIHPKSGQPMGPEFGVAVKQALACCSRSRPELQGVGVDVEDKQQHYVVASDGTALFAANSFAFDLQHPVIIPDSKLTNNKTVNNLKQNEKSNTENFSAFYVAAAFPITHEVIVKQGKTSFPSCRARLGARLHPHFWFVDCRYHADLVVGKQAEGEDQLHHVFQD